MKKMIILLIVLIGFTLSGCQKGLEDYAFEMDPNLGNEISNISDFLLEIDNNIDAELKIKNFYFSGSVEYIEGNYIVRGINIRSESIGEDSYYDQDSIVCSDLIWELEFEGIEGFHCMYYYNREKDYYDTALQMIDGTYITIQETIEFFEIANTSTLDSLNESDWQLTLFDQSHEVVFMYSTYDDHFVDFDNGVYHYGLYTSDEFISSGEHVLDGIYFEIHFYSIDTDELLMLYFLYEE